MNVLRVGNTFGFVRAHVKLINSLCILFHAAVDECTTFLQARVAMNLCSTTPLSAISPFSEFIGISPSTHTGGLSVEPVHLVDDIKLREVALSLLDFSGQQKNNFRQEDFYHLFLFLLLRLPLLPPPPPHRFLLCFSIACWAARCPDK